MKIFDGASGPLPLDKPGNYGRNAAIMKAIALLKASLRGQQELVKTPTRWTPADTLHTSEMYDNLFGYAEGYYAPFDKDGSGGVNKKEYENLRKAINKGTGVLGTLLKPILIPVQNWLMKREFEVKDLDGDGEISFAEDGAHTLLVDQSHRFVQDGMSGNTYGQVEGVITLEKLQNYMKLAMLAPKTARAKMEDIFKTHQLQQRFEEFKNKQ